MTPEQIAFVRLHQTGTDWVEEWRHLFQGATIRAKTRLGKFASLPVNAVQSLVDMGLMLPGHGGSFELTSEGRKI